MKSMLSFFSNLVNRPLVIATLLLLFSSTVQSQIVPSDWDLNSSSARLKTVSAFNILPSEYLNANISIENFDKKMQSNEQEMLLPNPAGDFETFVIKPSKVVADEVAHLYTVKTFQGYKKADPSVLVACDISSQGFHAAVFDAHNSYFIEPATRDAAPQHLIYYKKHLETGKVKCGVQSNMDEIILKAESAAKLAPPEKRTYRLAMVSSGEYSVEYGGSPYNVTNVLNSLAAGVNMVNVIYLRDLGIWLDLITNANLVFPDPLTDPFDLSDQGALIDENHAQCVAELGQDGFDVGHLVVWENTGGLAVLGAFCWEPNKGKGFSGANSSFTTIWVDYAAHELGHQAGSRHNFAAQECGTSADNYRFEPGEGSSIMSYANVCGAAVQYATASDPFFHYASIEQIQIEQATWGGCAVLSGAGNAFDPVPDAKADITIPQQTPFILVGSATDANDGTGPLTYDWEQYDGDGAETVGSPDCNSTESPMFRYRPPVSETYRHFPQYSDVLSGNNDIQWEKLPCTARTMNFSMAVRDNNATFGRVTHDQMVVTVANTGPFDVTYPNGGEVLVKPSTKGAKILDTNAETTVTWTVNGTDAHCANVDILLSTDSGDTYTVIADATANDGSETITLPIVITTTARVLVRCDVTGEFRTTSTFYDVSDADFTIDNPVPVELSHFGVEEVLGGIKLSWITESEIENLGFILERKTENSDWKELASYKTDDTLLGQGTISSATDYSYTDHLVEVGTTYEYRLADVGYSGVVTYHATREITVETKPLAKLEKFTVLPAYPNPFNPNTTIRYGLETDSQVSIQIYDITGKLISTLLDDNQSKGWHSITWDGTNGNGEQVPAGLYISRIKSNNEVITSKLMLLK